MALPEWAQWVFWGIVIAMLYHIGTKLDEIVKLLRRQGGAE